MPATRINGRTYEEVAVIASADKPLAVDVSNTSLGSIDGKLPALSSGNVPVAPNISRGSGAMDANTTRVTLATDGPGVSALSSIDTKTPALQSGASPVGDNGGSLTVDGKAYRAVVTITRPSNTTTYTAGDVVGDTGGSAIITLSSIGPTNGFVLIQSVALMFSDSSVPSGMGAFRVHFYTASPTAIADNAVFDIVSGDRTNYVGFVDLATPIDMGSSLYTQADYGGRLVRLASASTSLFALVETRGAYTPVSASTMELRVGTLEAGL